MNFLGLALILPLLMLLAIAVGFAVAARRGWVSARPRRGAATFLPASAPAAGGVARTVEATVLGVAALVILVGWRVLVGQLPGAAQSTSSQVLFVCVAIGAGIAVLLAIRGRTRAGASLLAVLVGIYGMAQVGNSAAWSPPLPAENPTVTYTIDLGGTNAKGADLWVNSVYLGKTPYTTTLSDFEAKVPYWPAPPADYKATKTGTHYGPRAPGFELRYRWIRFTRSQCYSSYTDRLPEKGTHPNRDEMAIYYAKVRYAGQWALAGTSSSGIALCNDAGWHIESLSGGYPPATTAAP